MTALKILILIAVSGYGASTAFLTGYFFFNYGENSRRAGFAAFIASCVIVVACFALSLTLSRDVPCLLLFVVMMDGLFLAVMKKWRTWGAGPFLSLFGIIILLVHFFRLPAAPASMPAEGDSAWLYLHVAFFLFTCACFTVAAFCAMLYLIQARLLKQKSLKGAFLRLPPLRELDEASYRLMGLGFPVLALGICSGSIWCHVHLGPCWSLRPGGITSIILVALYLICIHMRMISRWQGVRISLMLVISFCLMLCALVMMGHLPL